MNQQHERDIDAIVRGIESTPKAVRMLAVKVIETAIKDANRYASNEGVSQLRHYEAYRFLAALDGNATVAVWCELAGLDPEYFVQAMRTKFIDPNGGRDEFLRQWKRDSGRTEMSYRPIIHDCVLRATNDPRRATA